MLLRDILVIEENLTPAELVKYKGKYLSILIDLIDAGTRLPIDPEKRSGFSDPVAVINKEDIRALRDALEKAKAGAGKADIKSALPKKVRMTIDGKEQEQLLSLLFKSEKFTSRDNKKAYNSGHLAELFMGLCVTAKFISVGQPIGADQIMKLIPIDHEIDRKNYVFTITSNIQYPDRGAKTDTLNFLARIPARSAEEFLIQATAGKFDSDLQAVLSSTIKYVNDSASIKQSIQRVRNDKNNNHIDVVSDGTSNAKGTKADLTLKIDGSKERILSLKTYSSDTLGQVSGTDFDQISKWFNISFGLNLDKYRSYFDDKDNKETVYKNIIKLYDEVIFPAVKNLVDTQNPGEEADIVRQLARAANFFARGESMEDVEIVKLDDKASQGNYKILRFSENLEDAMKELDLEAKMIGKDGRTIQIFVKPEEGKDKGDKLCQFRTQKMGGYPRNYFETGPVLEALTEVSQIEANAPDKTEVTPGGTTLTVSSGTRELK